MLVQDFSASKSNPYWKKPVVTWLCWMWHATADTHLQKHPTVNQSTNPNYAKTALDILKMLNSHEYGRTNTHQTFRSQKVWQYYKPKSKPDSNSMRRTILRYNNLGLREYKFLACLSHAKREEGRKKRRKWMVFGEVCRRSWLLSAWKDTWRIQHCRGSIRPW